MHQISLLFLLTIFCSCMSVEKKQRRAAHIHQSFIEAHNSLWNIREVVKVADALYTVVHIQQKHYSDIFTDRVYEELEKERNSDRIQKIKEEYFSQIRNIDEVQKQIHDFLLAVTTEKDFLYVEGRSYPHRYRDIFLKEFTAKTIAAVEKNLNFGNSSIGVLDKPYFFIGASIPIHQQRRMHVVGAENLALLNLTLSLYGSKALSRADVNKLVKECHEARESEMLKSMSKNFDNLPHLMNTLRFLVCGSKHDFKNNVEKWNENNPEQKMNLIIFTPDKL